jgi:hypothetical protein
VKKFVRFVIALSIPALLFLSVYQVYRYQRLEQEVAQMREVQKELFERNKRLIAHIAILESPRRISQLAAEELDLEKVPIQERLRIMLSRKEEGNADG